MIFPRFLDLEKFSEFNLVIRVLVIVELIVDSLLIYQNLFKLLDELTKRFGTREYQRKFRAGVQWRWRLNSQAGIHGPKISKSRPGPNQDQQNFESPGPIRIPVHR